MLLGALYLKENICRTPEHLADVGARAQAERRRIGALDDTSETRRGMRYGLLNGMVAGSCIAHAAWLPYDVVVGTGSALLPATWAYHRAQFAGTPQPERCPFVIYGAPRGLLGPVVAASVGFIAGTSKVLGLVSGTMTGLVTSPVLLMYGGHAADFNAHIRRHKQLGGTLGLRIGHAGASMAAASACDALRVPSIAAKALCPVVGGALGVCCGALYGIKSQWPGGLEMWVAQAGEGASALSQMGVVIAIETAYLWHFGQARVRP